MMNEQNGKYYFAAPKTYDPPSPALNGDEFDDITPTTSNIERRMNAKAFVIQEERSFTEGCIKEAVIEALKAPEVIQILSTSIATVLKRLNHDNDGITTNSSPNQKRVKYWKEKYENEHRENTLLRAVQHIERVANRAKRRRISKAEKDGRDRASLSKTAAVRPDRETIHSIAASAAAAATSKKRCRAETRFDIGFERGNEKSPGVINDNKPSAMSLMSKSNLDKQPACYNNDYTFAATVDGNCSSRKSFGYDLKNRRRPRNVSLSPKNTKCLEVLDHVPDSDTEADVEVDSTQLRSVAVEAPKDDGRKKLPPPTSVVIQASMGFKNAGTGKDIEVTSESLTAAATVLSGKFKGKKESTRTSSRLTVHTNERKNSINSAKSSTTKTAAEFEVKQLHRDSGGSNVSFRRLLPVEEKDYGQPILQSPKFAYCEVVRKKNDRAALPAYTCLECQAFASAMASSKNGDGTNVFNSADIVQACSRHRSRFTPPKTPKGFWELSFADER